MWEKDGSEMALIPAGSFEMGDHLDGMVNALPVHRVELDAFYMAVHEVAVGQFMNSQWFWSLGTMQLPMPSGQSKGFPPKRNGSMQPEVD